MKPSLVVKRSIDIGGHKTSISLEDAFWGSLKEIALERRVTLSQLLASINANRRQFANLSSATRLFVLEFYKEQFDRIEQPEIPVQQAKPRKRRQPLTGRA
jgi:predicted DNA-binding ribbon-helix-helix protein